MTGTECPKWCTTDHETGNDAHVSDSTVIDTACAHVHVWVERHPTGAEFVRFGALDENARRTDPCMNPTTAVEFIEAFIAAVDTLTPA